MIFGDPPRPVSSWPGSGRIAWISTTPAMSGIGMFAAGLGWPDYIRWGWPRLWRRARTADARRDPLTLASRTAVLAAPFALGVVADLAGVVAGWGLVVALAAVALALVFALPAGAGESPPVSPCECVVTRRRGGRGGCRHELTAAGRSRPTAASGLDAGSTW